MAVQTKSFCRMSAHGVVTFQVWMEYEDTDFQTINDDGDSDDFRVIRWFGENYSDEPISVEVKHSNGTSWVNREISANSTFSQSAGGNVKYESDVPEWRYG